MNDYSEIINHPHYSSSKRPHMSMENRAAQFSAFAALTGYDRMLEDTRREVMESGRDDEEEKP